MTAPTLSFKQLIPVLAATYKKTGIVPSFDHPVPAWFVIGVLKTGTPITVNATK